MIKKAAVYTLGIAIATGGPIAYFAAPGYWNSAKQKWSSGDEASAGENLGEQAPPEATLKASDAVVASIERALPDGPPVKDLGEVLNLDVTPGWITSRWPRVTTGLSYLQLQGYRVPLFTGTDETDLAGSLTYYFNPQQRVQRITFRGTTGNARRLIALLTNRYRFTRRVVNDPGLFVYEAASQNGALSGALKVQAARVVRSDDRFHRFQVDLILERPS
jgi:hypothetical protein